MAFKNRKKNYPLYETTHFRDTREMTENVAARYPDRYAITYRKHPSDAEPLHLTFAECRDTVRDLGTAFVDMGMRDRTVAIIGEASPEWILSYFALMSVGAVTVPIDKELPAADIISIMNTAECAFLVYSPKIEKKLDAIREAVPTLTFFVEMGDETPAEGSVSIDTVRKKGAELYAAGDNAYYDYEIDVDRLASIVFTSGTTGKGKGVMLSMRNICSDMEQGMYNFQITYKTMCLLPPHHTFGSTVNFIGHFAQGCELYISSGLKYIMKELAEFQPTHLVLVPLFVETFYKRITATAEKTGKLGLLKKIIKVSNGLRKIGIDLRRVLFKSVTKNFGGKLEMIICGGAALNQDIIDFFEDIGITILNGYGITECAPLISCNRNEYRKNASVGLPIIGGHVRIIDPDENGEGEIAYKGPNVMLGYYKNEEATREVIDADGYFHTGDYGKVETEGNDQWIYITGRLKNLIIFSNGKNVYPEELETDIQGVYGVNEVVVYAGESKSDPSKEVIVAEIYPDADALKLHNVEDAQTYFENAVKEINQKNVSYKSIGKVKLRDVEFPKNTSRKITRFAIDKSID
ncbi:MAG: AMP-binding protein [Clostridia bacterium]|nr:AMP-binding protein [Clostridia bacterium]